MRTINAGSNLAVSCISSAVHACWPDPVGAPGLGAVTGFDVRVDERDVGSPVGAAVGCPVDMDGGQASGKT